MKGGTVNLAAVDVPRAELLRESQLQKVVGRLHLAVKPMTPTFTGHLENDFAGASIVSYQKSDDAAVRSSAVWDANNLYLGWDVADATPWQNAAKAPEDMYFSGDTVDFQLGTDAGANPNRTEAGLGDLRLSIGNLQGTATAVLYRKKSLIKKPKTFSSGVVAAYPMEFVDVLAEAKITVVKRDNGYCVEAAIPFASLEWKPTDGEVARGDFGATHGGPDGSRTRLRTYWNNQHTGIVDDAVFELMMEPQNWGELQFLGK